MKIDPCKECGREFYDEPTLFEIITDNVKIVLILSFFSLVPIAAIKILFFQ